MEIDVQHLLELTLLQCSITESIEKSINDHGFKHLNYAMTARVESNLRNEAEILMGFKLRGE